VTVVPVMSAMVEKGMYPSSMVTLAKLIQKCSLSTTSSPVFSKLPWSVLIVPLRTP
jgi:hypothetical protein